MIRILKGNELVFSLFVLCISGDVRQASIEGLLLRKEEPTPADLVMAAKKTCNLVVSERIKYIRHSEKQSDPCSCHWCRCDFCR